MKQSQVITPIAHIETDFSEKFGIPRQSGKVKSLIARIIFTTEYRNPEAIRGIEEFSHLWLIFDFSKAHRKDFSPTVRPPRLGGNKRVGVFASRSPFRPNSLGLSSVKLIGIENDEKFGQVLIVSGADLLNGTPIYDIKPYLSYTDCHTDAIGSYADANLSHKLSVEVEEELLLKFPQGKRDAMLDCIREDPRPSYQSDPERLYAMSFAGYDIRFYVNGTTAKIVEIEKRSASD